MHAKSENIPGMGSNRNGLAPFSDSKSAGSDECRCLPYQDKTLVECYLIIKKMT